MAALSLCLRADGRSESLSNLATTPGSQDDAHPIDEFGGVQFFFLLLDPMSLGDSLGNAG